MSLPSDVSTAREAPSRLDRIVASIDGLSTATGWVAGWLMVPMTLAITYEVVARYAFHAPTVWAYDSTYMFFGAQFMLAAAYTLLRGGHTVRTIDLSGPGMSSSARHEGPVTADRPDSASDPPPADAGGDSRKIASA